MKENRKQVSEKGEKNTPEKRINASPVVATIWKNEVQKGKEKAYFYTISLQRNYKDKDGGWKQTGSFRVQDLPKASLALQKAYEYLAIRDESSYIDEEDVEL